MRLESQHIAAYAGHIEKDLDGLVLAQVTDTDGVEWRLAMVPVANTLNTPAYSVQGLVEWEEGGKKMRRWSEADAYYILSDAADHFCAILDGICGVEAAAYAGKVSHF